MGIVHDAIARAIARSHAWQIVPSGVTALNYLGLSTQGSNKYEYSRSGQYKTYQIGEAEISFKRRSSKEILHLSPKSALVVQAAKECGPLISDGTIKKIKGYLSEKEKALLQKERSLVTQWIFEVIKRICALEH